MGKASKKDTRRLAREQRRAQQADRTRRSRRSRRLWLVAAAAVVVVAAAWAVWSATRPAPATAPAGGSGSAQPARPPIVEVPDQGRDHVAPGAPHPAYNSNPPASGWHYAATAPWGFHNSTLPDELLLHNLEHGGIWISYKDDTDTPVVDALVALAREQPRKVVITHRPSNDSRIAVVAWDRLMKLSRFDREAILDFINRFKNKGPEFVPD